MIIACATCLAAIDAGRAGEQPCGHTVGSVKSYGPDDEHEPGLVLVAHLRMPPRRIRSSLPVARVVRRRA